MPITEASSGVVKELATYVGDASIDVLSSGTSIAICAQVDESIINIVDTFPGQDDTGREPQKLFYIHRLALPTVSTIRKISCGDNHCLVLCGASCFSYGSNAYGELGIGVRSEHSNTLRAAHLSSSLPVAGMAAGNNYSALVTRCGQVYTFGNGAYFKLGHGDDEDRLLPTRVVELENVGEFQSDGTFAGVKYIACGRWHTVVVTHGTNDAYGWGWNKFGNLGANPASRGNDIDSVHKEEIIALPRRIEDLDGAHLLGDGGLDGNNHYQQVTKVTCGSRHTALLTSAGKVIVIGPLGPSPIEGIDKSSIYKFITRNNSAECVVNVTPDVRGQKRSLVTDYDDECQHRQRHKRDNFIKEDLVEPRLPKSSLGNMCDYRARLLCIPNYASHQNGDKRDTAKETCVVTDICSHSWTLVCISIAISYVLHNTVNQDYSPIPKLTQTWSTKPIVSVYVPNAEQAGFCNSDYEYMSIRNDFVISSVSEGPCGCAQNSLSFHSTNAKCPVDLESSDSCMSLSALSPIPSTTYRGSGICIKRGGVPAATVKNDKYHSRPHKDHYDACECTDPFTMNVLLTGLQNRHRFCLLLHLVIVICIAIICCLLPRPTVRPSPAPAYTSATAMTRATHTSARAVPTSAVRRASPTVSTTPTVSAAVVANADTSTGNRATTTAGTTSVVATPVEVQMVQQDRHGEQEPLLQSDHMV
eukprot:gene9620-11313_t